MLVSRASAHTTINTQKGDGLVASAEIGTILRALGQVSVNCTRSLALTRFQNPTETDVKKVRSQLDSKGLSLHKWLTRGLHVQATSASASRNSYPCSSLARRRSPRVASRILSRVCACSTRTPTAPSVLPVRRRLCMPVSHQSPLELRHVLTSLGEKLTDDDVDVLLNCMQARSDGSVNYEGAPLRL